MKNTLTRISQLLKIQLYLPFLDQVARDTSAVGDTERAKRTKLRDRHKETAVKGRGGRSRCLVRKRSSQRVKRPKASSWANSNSSEGMPGCQWLHNKCGRTQVQGRPALFHTLKTASDRSPDALWHRAPTRGKWNQILSLCTKRPLWLPGSTWGSAASFIKPQLP